MRLARATVRKYAAADAFPARLPHGPGPSLLDPHVDYLLGRIGEGCENALALWREIRERGYPGTSRQVHRFVADRRTKPTRSGRKPRGEATPMPDRRPAGAVLPSARQLAWLLVQPASALDGVAAAVVARVEQDATASAVADLARRFTAHRRDRRDRIPGEPPGAQRRGGGGAGRRCGPRLRRGGSEVRALAQRSAEAEKEIKRLILTSGVQVEHGVAYVGQTGEALVRIISRVAEIDGTVGEIASSAAEQATGLDQVNTAVNQMDQVTQQNAAMVEESTAASHALAQETGELGRLISAFRLGDAAEAPRRTPVLQAERRPSPRPVAMLKTVGRGIAAAKVAADAYQDWGEF